MMTLALLIAMTSNLTNDIPQTTASVVKLTNSSGKYSLSVNGKPYLVKGAGGNNNLQLLAQSEGNTVRTWGADNLQADLDRAHAAGIMVTAGIWLQHSDSFDYSNAAEVKKQHDAALEVVKKFKNHPALLMWAFGNEMEAYGEANDPNLWNAVNSIARDAKKFDPNHPTMTVIAEIGAQRLPSIKKYCPDIDIVGVNSYGGAASLAERYRPFNVGKPYMITEFGPLGTWEMPKTPWGAPIEQTSTEKIETYRNAYEKNVLDASDICIGSFAFLWGNKQEGTSTWFGMFLPDGTKTSAVDVMTEFWRGKKPDNLCPRIQSLTVSQKENLKPGQRIVATLRATDPESNSIKVKWVLVEETKVYLTAGRDEAIPDPFPKALVESSNTEATFQLPEAPGNYRVFAYVYDGKGGAAVANIPIQSK